MNKLLVLFGLVLIHGFGSCSSMAQSLSVSPYDVYGIQSPLNYVKNPFAKDNGMYVTSSSASCGRDGSTNKLFGYASHTVDTSALSGYCEYELKPIVAPHTNGNCEFKGVVFGDGSLYRAQVLNSTPTLVAQTLPLVNGTGGWAEFSVNAPCSSAPKVRITQTEAGTSPQIKVGLNYTPATNIGKGKLPEWYTAYVDGTTVTDQKPVNWISSCSLGTAPDVNCTYVSNTFSQAPTCFVGPLSGTAAAPTGNRTYSSTASGIGVTSTVTVSGNPSRIPFNIACRKTGSDYQPDVITAPNWNFDWKNYTGTVTAASGTIPSHTIQYMKYRRTGGQMWIKGKGTFTATGAGWSGIRPPYPTGITTGSFGAAVLSDIKLNDISDTIYDGKVLLGASAATLYAQVTNISGKFSGIGPGTPFTWTSGDEFYWEIGPIDAIENGVPWTETYNAQQLNSAVISRDSNIFQFDLWSSSGADCVSGTCASIGYKTPGTTVSYSSAGTYNVAFGATYGAEPTCVVTNSRGNSGHDCVMDNNSLTTAGARVICQISNTAATLVNSRFNLQCFGPRP